MNPSEIINWELAARVLSGEADEIDQGLLNQWLAQSEENRKEWEQMQEAWQRGGEAMVSESLNVNDAWHRVSFQMTESRPKKRRTPSLRVAVAAVAAILIGAIGLVWMLSPPASTPSSLVVTSNQTEEIQLSDGSMVTLNSGSKFTCSQPFAAGRRTVQLQGEGYFKVQGNSEWPFVVQAGEVTVRVTGTRFNVRAYPVLDVTEVTVFEGEVEVSVPGRDETPTEVVGGQVALFHGGTNVLTVRQNTDKNVLAWLTRRLQFTETYLSQVVETLERVYGVHIQLADSSLNDKKLTAQFSDNSLDFVLNVVAMTFNLDTLREGDTIVMKPAGKN